MINLKPKANPFKTALIWEEMSQAGGPSMICIIAWSRQIVNIKKKLKKIDCHVMHLKNSIRPEQESRKRKKMLKKMMKITYTRITFFLFQGITLQFRWLCLRWEMTIFHHPITDRKKLSIVTPFEPDNFSFNNSTKDHPLH